MEIPYIAVQTISYGIITYFMINFERTIGMILYRSVRVCEYNLFKILIYCCYAGKFLLYLAFMFLTFTYFTFYGMVAIGLTPNQQLAAVVSSAFYSLWNLLAGFLVPKPVKKFY